MCCLVIFWGVFFILLICAMAHLHTISPQRCCRGVVHIAVPRPRHWLPALQTPTPTPPGQPIARYFPPVTQKSPPRPPPPPPHHESSLTEGRLGGWDHTRGEGTQEVEQGFRYINPRATVVTHSLTQIAALGRPWLTQLRHSRSWKKKEFAAKKVQVFQPMGKHSRTTQCLVQSDLKSTIN